VHADLGRAVCCHAKRLQPAAAGRARPSRGPREHLLRIDLNLGAPAQQGSAQGSEQGGGAQHDKTRRNKKTATDVSDQRTGFSSQRARERAGGAGARGGGGWGARGKDRVDADSGLARCAAAARLGQKAAGAEDVLAARARARLLRHEEQKAPAPRPLPGAGRGCQRTLVISPPPSSDHKFLLVTQRAIQDIEPSAAGEEACAAPARRARGHTASEYPWHSGASAWIMRETRGGSASGAMHFFCRQ